MQGHLLQKDLTCSVETRCAVSGRTIEFEMDSGLRLALRAPSEQPLLVIPLINLAALDAPSIVDDF